MMSTKGPGLFSDIGKKAKDLLAKDYSSDQRFALTSSTDTGLELNSILVKRGGLSSGNVTAKYKHGNTTVDVKIDTDSNVRTTFAVSDIVPSTKTIASIILPDYQKSGKLEVQYLHEHVAFSTAVGLNKYPAIDFSGTIGTSGISFGAETTYSSATGNFSKYNAGLSLTQPTSNFSVLLADKGDSLKVSYLRHLVRLNGGAVVGEIDRRFSTNENTLTVGCLYLFDPRTIVKAKLNNHGNLGALLQHEITPKSFLTISGAFETKALEKSPKFGFALSLKP